ncbi:hypothetical protein CAOG_04126 [Capsaspora owczarzaki ATCC 30864]|uniref:Enoyl reductase (ER) domain-containing protein n=1 Tax=Capsaspora owczarzaki (strain ATCC 30864) TaxID=595528 RepID=A0A0D2UDZ4_CAPO3|nr:hypothetical protein CAOG_04126 [Capsaspora owczarzaki ATCC 30864]KJE93321.1 hypothetical protein CAOG_004126 [Capsaspora owczarzaki ATCC 30864]|eukprot:XP_004347951.2 hypothetical protein CAOG_04126 [Capsaspora owczarzaki ATCC 30864]
MFRLALKGSSLSVASASSRRLAAIAAGLVSTVPAASHGTHASSCSAGPIPASMNAIVLTATGPEENLKMTNIPVAAPATNEVLVKIAACAVCYRDLLDRKGAFPFIMTPIVPGHEIAGTVAQVGTNVKDLSVGDRVVSLHWGSCGQCPACLANHTTSCEQARASFLGLTANGGYAPFITASARTFTKVPAQFTSIQASAIMCTFAVAWRAAVTRGRLKAGEKIVVTGATGGVGSAMVVLAKAMGCTVTAVTSSDAKVDYLKGLGADHVVVAKNSTFKIPDEFKPTLAFEAVGEPTFNSSLRSLHTGGRLILIGNVTVGAINLKLGYLIINSIEIIGSDSCTATELQDVMAFMVKHNIRPNISAVLPLGEAADAHRMLANRGATGRVVLKVDEQSSW